MNAKITRAIGDFEATGRQAKLPLAAQAVSPVDGKVAEQVSLWDEGHLFAEVDVLPLPTLCLRIQLALAAYFPSRRI